MASVPQQPGFGSQPLAASHGIAQVQGAGLDATDAVSSYFECITACSLDDGECVTRCVEVLRDSP